MVNSLLIELQLPPVGCASQAGLGRYTGGGGGLHWGAGVASRLEFLRSAEGKNDYSRIDDSLRNNEVCNLGMVLNCYRTFEERVEDVLHTSVSKPNRIRNVIDRTLGKFKKSDLIEKCPDISEITIERALKQFLDEGYICKIGGGRGTAYAKRM